MKDESTDMYERYSKTDPTDVAPAGGRWTPVEPLRGWGFTTDRALLAEAFLRGLFASYALQHTPRQTHLPVTS